MNRITIFISLCSMIFASSQALAVLHSTIAVDQVIVVAASAAAGSGAVVDDVPMGQSGGENVSLLPEDAGSIEEADLFGLEGGYFHPYISLQGEFTDNLFNIDTNTTSNFLTKVSPGIWFALPRKKIIPITITPHNSSAGGLQLQIEDYEGTDRYQLYALGGVDFKMYSEDSDLNSNDIYLEGLGRYNMAGGLSLQALDRYTQSSDRFDIGNSTGDNVREYDSNLFMATADWDFTEKLRAQVDYSNFMLDYTDDINAFLERQDNVVDLYGYFKYSLKTAFFLQYRYTDIAYDSATVKDNTQDAFYGGVRWNTTDKLALMFKAGYQSKEYETTVPGYDDYDGWVVDLQTLYRFTEKTELVFDMYRKNEETDSAVASEKVVLGGRLGYTQKVTDKITGKFDFIYENADYAQLIAQERDDDRFFFRPAVQYLFKEWLMAEVAYSYDKRDSTDDLFDYDTNTFLFNINLSL